MITLDAERTLKTFLDGSRPTVAQMGEICTAFHAIMVEGNDPELQYITISFEDMADAVHNAIKDAAKVNQLPADESWKARQDSLLAQACGLDGPIGMLANLRIQP
jgi:hypothetical protein